MRVVYACQDLACDEATGIGAQTFASASAMAAAGHDVQLVSAELGEPWRRRLAGFDRLSWRQVQPERAGHVYFTERLGYSDRLYDTILALHAEAPLDVVEVPDAGGDALTLLRAKRLLGRFRTTCLAISRQPGSTVRQKVQAQRTAGFAAELTAYAQSYALRHADLVLSAVSVDVDGFVGERAHRCLPGPLAQPIEAEGVAEDDPFTILWLGPISPGAGLGTMLRALVLAREQEPGLCLVLRGADTDTDPVGGPYWPYLHRRLPESLREAVTWGGPLRVDQVATLPPPGTPCVLASGLSGTPLDALVAMASAHRVIALAGSIGAELIRDGETGHVVPDGDPAALASALLAGRRESAACALFGELAKATVYQQYSLERVAERLSEIYARSPTPSPARSWAGARGRPRERVSVVIPLYNQGEFLPAALESVRRSGLGELDIIVVDDGSTDPHTVAVLDSLQGVRIVRHPHRGLSAARNTGIGRARGDLVLVLDADDLLAPGFLPAAVQALHQREDLAFVAGYVRYFGLLDLVYVPAGPAGALNLVLHTHLKSTVLYRLEALERVGGYDESLPAFEDWEIQIRLAQAGYDSDVLPIIGQLYRRHAGSMSFSVSNGMRGELIQYLVRKHAPTLSKSQLVTLLQNLVDMWKTGYEPSRSVLLQQAEQVRSDGAADGGLTP